MNVAATGAEGSLEWRLPTRLKAVYGVEAVPVPRSPWKPICDSFQTLLEAMTDDETDPVGRRQAARCRQACKAPRLREDDRRLWPRPRTVDRDGRPCPGRRMNCYSLSASGPGH